MGKRTHKKNYGRPPVAPTFLSATRTSRPSCLRGEIFIPELSSNHWTVALTVNPVSLVLDRFA
jgi:hypothetical protein